MRTANALSGVITCDWFGIDWSGIDWFGIDGIGIDGFGFNLRAIFLWLCLLFSPVGIISAATTATASNDLQSLLMLIDDAGLRIEKRVPADLSNRTSTPTTAAMQAAIRRSTGETESDSTAGFPVAPEARWYSDTGAVLAITHFVDPRILRAPQQGTRVHDGIVVSTAARFLVRGPLDAVNVEIFLPDISGFIEIRPLPDDGVVTETGAVTATDKALDPATVTAATTPNDGQRIERRSPVQDPRGAAASLSQQQWVFDL